ncbi:MAG: hypothetical protein M5U34_12415 [Chloroflexi bacterium]|nr:hypothetical protein [Chloroflexota bacterium]
MRRTASSGDQAALASTQNFGVRPDFTDGGDAGDVVGAAQFYFEDGVALHLPGFFRHLFRSINAEGEGCHQRLGAGQVEQLV